MCRFSTKRHQCRRSRRRQTRVPRFDAGGTLKVENRRPGAAPLVVLPGRREPLSRSHRHARVAGMSTDAEWDARYAAAPDGMFSGNVNGTLAIEVATMQRRTALDARVIRGLG